VSFRSNIYPYSWTLPSGITTRNWHPATRQWRTDERIDSIAAYNDANGTVDGTLFVFGAPWTRGLDDFTTLIKGGAARFHGCGDPAEVRSVQLGGGPAIMLRQTCGGGVLAARVVLVHGGFGLAINVSEISPSKVDVVLDDLEAWLAGFAWTGAS
jgi:hypothetical protein